MFCHLWHNFDDRAELTSLAIESGGRLFLLINNLFRTILLNLAFVLRARNLYSYEHITTITVKSSTITCLLRYEVNNNKQVIKVI